MVILRSQNKITDFLMILAWASPFKYVVNFIDLFDAIIGVSDMRSATLASFKNFIFGKEAYPGCAQATTSHRPLK